MKRYKNINTMPKPYKKKYYTPTKIGKAYKPLKKVVKYEVDKYMKKESELKLWDWNNGINGQLINRSNPTILNLFSPSVGDEYYQRNGNKVVLSSMDLRITCEIKSGVVARFILFTSKDAGATVDSSIWSAGSGLVRVGDSEGSNAQYNIYGVPAKVYNEDFVILRDWSVVGRNNTSTDIHVINKSINLKKHKYEFAKDSTTYPTGAIYLGMVASQDSDLSPNVYVNSEVRFRDI